MAYPASIEGEDPIYDTDTPGRLAQVQTPEGNIDYKQGRG